MAFKYINININIININIKINLKKWFILPEKKQFQVKFFFNIIYHIFISKNNLQKHSNMKFEFKKKVLNNYLYFGK